MENPNDKYRGWLGIAVIVISVLLLIVVSIMIISGEKSSVEDYKYVFTSILPLVGTWVGVVLAFYFGKENYDAVSKNYKQIIDRLSPEILDDIPVGRVMILKKTMILKKWSEIKNKTINEVRDFLLSVDKSRLPVLDNNGKVLYIIHTSMLSQPEKDDSGNVKPIDGKEKMESFVERNKKTFGQVVTAKSEDTVEIVRGLMNLKPGCKDVFVLGANDTTIGWITDTLILRYINSKKI